MSCTLIKPPLILCVWKPTESRTDAHKAFWISRRLPSQICERADCSRGFTAENRLHGTAKDSLVDFNDTEMGAGRILINDLSVDSPELSGNDRTGVDVEFSQHNEYWCQDSGPNALLMSWCLKELVTVYLVNTHLHLDASICLSICFYSYLIWPVYLRIFKGRTSLSPYRFLMLLSSEKTMLLWPDVRRRQRSPWARGLQQKFPENQERTSNEPPLLCLYCSLLIGRKSSSIILIFQGRQRTQLVLPPPRFAIKE